jgi:ribosomal protein L29
MTRTEMQTRIRALKEELENRHKYGTVKLAKEDGVTPIPVKDLQAELFNLIYKVSRIDSEDL